MTLLRTQVQLLTLSVCLGILAIAGQAPLDKQIEEQTAQLRSRRAAIDSVKDDKKKAQLWLELNRAADGLAELLSKKPVERTPQGPPDVVPAPDVRILYCEIGNVWAAVPAGYQSYLKLWPDGPDADEAYWKTEVEPSGCGDFEGTEEEYRDGIKRYETFLQKYPNSRFAAQASSQLKAYQEGLEELLAPKPKP